MSSPPTAAGPEAEPAEVPQEHEVPDELVAGRRVPGRDPRPVARGARRRAAQDPPRRAARPGGGGAAPHRGDRRARSRRSTRPRTPATCPDGRRPRAAAVRPRRAGRGGRQRRAGRLGHPAAARAPRRRGARRRRCSPTWRTASPRCGWCSARARCRSTALADVLAGVLPGPRAGGARSGRRARAAAEAFLDARRRAQPTWRAGGPRRWTRWGCTRAPAEAQDLSGAGRPGPPAAAPLRRCAPVAVDATAFHDAGASAVRGAGLLAWPPGSAYLRALTDARARRRRGVRGSWSSATPPPPTSSRPSPSCAPPAGCGTGWGRSSAPRRTPAPSASTPSPRR